MPNYTCITGGLVMNGKKYHCGKVYYFPRNPAEEHFVFLDDYEAGKKEPRPGQQVNVKVKKPLVAEGLKNSKKKQKEW